MQPHRRKAFANGKALRLCQFAVIAEDFGQPIERNPGIEVMHMVDADTTDHRTIWDRLDQIHAKHPDMVLMHGGSPKGAERIAATWASNRKVPQVAFKPDWTKHAKAAPFKRNDQMLDCLPIGVIIFPGTGIQENLADKARKMGIPVYRMAKGGA